MNTPLPPTSNLGLGIGLGLQVPYASQILQLIEVRDQWFNGKTAAIDGYVFYNCRFDNCNLTVTTTNFAFHDCHISDNCVVSYSTGHAKILKLFLNKYPWAKQWMPSFFFPTEKFENNTRTITIAD